MDGERLLKLPKRLPLGFCSSATRTPSVVTEAVGLLGHVGTDRPQPHPSFVEVFG
jgi:hypothetical protein